MTDIKIAELNEAPDFADLTDEEINSWSTEKLRQVAAENVEDYTLYDTIATLPADDVMFAAPKGLSTLETFIQALLKTYAHRGAKVVKRYDMVEIKVFNTDANLRQRLIYKRDQEREQRDA